MKRKQDVLDTIGKAIEIFLVFVLAFVVGLTAGLFYNLFRISSHTVHNYKTSLMSSAHNWDYCFSPLPEKLLTDYYSDRGMVYFDDPATFESEEWACGYYVLETHEIHVLTGTEDDPLMTLAHEMGHYIYNTTEFDKEEWRSIAYSNWDKSIYSQCTGPDDTPYYSDPEELFAQEVGLYFVSHEYPDCYSPINDYEIAYIFEDTVNNQVTSYIENFLSTYYN